ncbi:MAG TPA: OmpA family protein [Kofleriaceae bacterium]|jgi:peptidoglycan-associated lipoprotein
MVRVALVSLLFAAACHHATPATTTPVAATPPAAQPAPAQQASPSVYVSDDLAKKCTLHMDNVQEAPKFDYNETSLEPADRDVLEAIATCVTKGPLKGHHLQLVGRADPRGTEEYNMGLGSRRAGTVRQFLQRLGVTQGQLAQTTRGALDANGTDDSGWRQDRRVDITLQ